MKQTAKFTCIASVMVSSLAFSDELFPLGPAENQTDGLLKYYCTIQSQDHAEACLDAIKAWAGEEIVATCADSVAKAIIASSPPGAVKYMDMIDGGDWHRKYHKDKDGSDHRHDWSESARDEGGRRMGTTFIDRLRKNSYDEQIQKGTSKSSVSTAAMSAGVSAGLTGSATDTETVGSGTTQTWTYKGPSDQELDDAYRKGYIEGYLNPQKTGLNPDISCHKGEKECYGPQNSPKNEYPKSDPPPKKAPEKTPSRTSSNDSPSGTKTASDSHDTSLHSSPVISSHSAGESWAGEDYTKPDTIIATVAEDGIRRDPLQTCVMNAVGQKFGKDGLGALTIEQPTSSKTPEQQKEINNQMLKMGMCDEGYWGKEYCLAFYRKQNLGMAPSVHGIYIDTTPSYRLPQTLPGMNPGTVDFANPDGLVPTGGQLDMEAILSGAKPMPTAPFGRFQ